MPQYEIPRGIGAPNVGRVMPPPPPGSRRRKKLQDAAANLNVRLYRLSGGRIGGRYDQAPVCILHHVGAKSGERRETPLVHLPDGDRIVLAASMGGNPRNPAWYHNLRANPDTTVQIGSDRIPVHARVASDEEYDRLWKLMVGVYGGYEDYRKRTDRKIPLIVLERRG